MRVRDHVALSSGAAALLYPAFGPAVTIPWLAAILIDGDHYLWFVCQYRRVSLAAAMRRFTQADAPTHAATRPLHHPVALLVLLAVGRRRRVVRLAVIGMMSHAMLDVFHRRRSRILQGASLRRDGFTCRVCGASAGDVVAHIWRQPFLLPSYRAEDLLTLCESCHHAAHARGARLVFGAGPRVQIRRAG